MIVLDIETFDTFARYAHLPRAAQLAALRFGLATVVSDDETPIQYWSHNLPSAHVCLSQDESDESIAVVQGTDVLPLLWERLIAPAPVVGWNILGFDIPFLMIQLAMHGYADRALWETNLPTIDLFDRIREASRRETGTERWYKLAVVAQATLQRDTTATGD